MKNLIILCLLLFSMGLMSSCSKDPSHSIRFNNNYIETINDVKVNSTSYGNIDKGATTDYKPVDEGNFTLSGTTASGQPWTGGGTVNGAGKHKWTITIRDNGGINLAEDK